VIASQNEALHLFTGALVFADDRPITTDLDFTRIRAHPPQARTFVEPPVPAWARVFIGPIACATEKI
jgi:hypothetical protein